MTKNDKNLICLIISNLQFLLLFFGSQKIQPNVVFKFKMQQISLIFQFRAINSKLLKSHTLNNTFFKILLHLSNTNNGLLITF